jgi:diamine N-acetyltransferase
MKIYQTRDHEIIANLNEDVQNVHAHLYPDYFKKFNLENVKEFFKKIINKPDFIFLLIEDNEISQGYAWIEIRHNPENAFKKAYKLLYVHQISISESSRNKGFGSMLMEEIYEIARKSEVKQIELDYWCDNQIAKDFYQKQGFTISREFVQKNTTDL